ncbi:MAG: stage IV sporulation protein A [Christensenellales bacterium]|jgi:stage IV sporulation protein A
MENYDIYKDIATRTNGDIYIGVVGPVRCGKSTFITKFMEKIVVPNIENKHAKQRTIDELPQSGEGKTIMTTQPRFVPNEGVSVVLNGNVETKVRMVDCVGYMVSGALGFEEGKKPRLVKTPWSEEDMPFQTAAEFGTRKVIEDHSTIAVLMTTDGSICELPREAYVQAEERVAAELKKSGKPFVVVLNSVDPSKPEVKALAKQLEKKYQTGVVCLNAKSLSLADVDEIFEKMLLEFPLKSLKIQMPDWLRALSYNDEMISEIISEVKKFGDNVTKIGQIDKTNVAFLEHEDFEPVTVGAIKMGEGTIMFNIVPKPHVFYKVLSKQCGFKIENDLALVSYIKTLAHAKRQYDKLEKALQEVDETGYGIVVPSIEELTLEDPQIVKQGTRFGMKLKASAPSLHIMKVDIETEISPLVGTQAQSEELAQHLMSEFENNPQSIWETNIFGKSLNSLVNEGINSKIVTMPLEAQRKMRKTLGKIVNEGKGGIICILL